MLSSFQEQKRKYDEETKRICAMQDKHYQLKNKTKEEQLKEVILCMNVVSNLGMWLFSAGNLHSKKIIKKQ